MSTAHSAAPSASPARDTSDSAPAVPEVQIRVYGHSNLFYWWPVWVAGFVMAILTYTDGHELAIVPEGTRFESDVGLPGEKTPRDVLIAPPGQTFQSLPETKEGEMSPRLRIAANNSLGVVFVGILLLVVLISNYIFRGLVSVIAIALLAVIILLFALLDWWNPILAWLGGLDIRMNAEGYLAIAIPLLILWLFTTFIYDRYTYMIINRGQVRIRQAIGDGETVVDSTGLLFDKKRNDIFRHWLLGLGAGDLHVKTSSPGNLDFELPNVLFIGTKLRRIQDLLREKEVAPSSA